MDDLVAFLNARLDEDEEIARATSRPAWRQWYTEPWYDGGFLNDGRTERCDLAGASGAGLFTGQGAIPTVMAAHIARHDPARALREVEVKRKLIAVYEDANGGYSPDHFDGYWDAIWQFAAVYRDHPDYRPEWDFTAAS